MARKYYEIIINGKDHVLFSDLETAKFEASKFGCLVHEIESKVVYDGSSDNRIFDVRAYSPTGSYDLNQFVPACGLHDILTRFIESQDSRKLIIYKTDKIWSLV